MRIGIAGAGLIGRLAAWQLSRAGHEVSLFDRDDRSGQQSAAWAAAAMLAPLSEAAACEAEIAEQGLRGLHLWPELLDTLIAESGQPIDYAIEGSVVVAHGLDRSSLQMFERQLRDKQPADAHVLKLDAEGLAKLEPQLAARFDSGLLLADEGYLDNRALLAALDKALLLSNVRWYSNTEVISTGAGSLELKQSTERFDLVLDCRGVGAKSQSEGLRGVRGEILRVHAPEVSISRPVRLMHPRYQLYLSPRKAGHYVIGATEIESESMQPVTVRSQMELLSALYSLHPAFAEASIESAEAQLRPAFADNLPQLKNEPGLIQINGLYRHGYLLAPVMLEKLREALATQQGNIAEVA